MTPVPLTAADLVQDAFVWVVRTPSAPCRAQVGQTLATFREVTDARGRVVGKRYTPGDLCFWPIRVDHSASPKPTHGPEFFKWPYEFGNAIRAGEGVAAFHTEEDAKAWRKAALLEWRAARAAEDAAHFEDAGLLSGWTDWLDDGPSPPEGELLLVETFSGDVTTAEFIPATPFEPEQWVAGYVTAGGNCSVHDVRRWRSLKGMVSEVKDWTAGDPAEVRENHGRGALVARVTVSRVTSSRVYVTLDGTAWDGWFHRGTGELADRADLSNKRLVRSFRTEGGGV